jgi:hypothetical protein
VHEVATCRCPAEHRGKLGVIDEPVRVEGGPILVGSVGDAIHDVVDLAGLLQ